MVGARCSWSSASSTHGRGSSAVLGARPPGEFDHARASVAISTCQGRWELGDIFILVRLLSPLCSHARSRTSSASMGVGFMSSALAKRWKPDNARAHPPHAVAAC
ncbi:hypothetical protein Dimus_037356 [Dionaea muscipula]